MFLNTEILANGGESNNTPLQPEIIPMSEDLNADGTPKKKRGRPKKSETEMTTIPPAPAAGQNAGVPLCQSDAPYLDTFSETNDMLKLSIMQLDVLTGDVKNELDSIRASKTLKGKYKYISELCSTASSLVSSKISAIKEINAVTHNCHKLELQRIKDVKNSMVNKQDDDKYITDLYNAYINTPISAGQNPMLQYTSANIAGNQAALMAGINTVATNEDQNFQNYMSNLSPEQNRMILGNNPNIETVVVFNPMTGEKQFDVIDNTTGMSVPNYPRPADSILDGTSVDTSTGMATNTNLGQTWKVVVPGDAINQF